MNRYGHASKVALLVGAVLFVASCGTPSGSVSVNGSSHTCAYGVDNPKIWGTVGLLCMNLCPSGSVAPDCKVYGRAPILCTVTDPTAPAGTPAGTTMFDPIPVRCGCSGGVWGDSTRAVRTFLGGVVVLR